MLRRRRLSSPFAVAVSPGTAAVTGTATQQFTVVVSNVFGTALTWAGTWLSGSPAKATINSTGLATGVADVVGSSLTAVVAGSSTTTLRDPGQGWTINAHAGRFVVVTAGTNNGVTRAILSNTAEVLTTVAFPVAHDATTVYSITNGGALPSNINFQAGRIVDASPAVLTCNP